MIVGGCTLSDSIFDYDVANKWASLISMTLFTFSDGKHQRKKIAITNAVAQCEWTLKAL